MTQSKMYKRHRFPPEIIQYAVWLYHHFSLNHRDIEDLMLQRGIEVNYETIRLWCNKFGSKYAQRLRRRHQEYGDSFFIDEVFVKIRGKQHYLWRAVDQAQRFLGAHAAVYNLFNLGRHLVSTENYRYFRQRAFASWERQSEYKRRRLFFLQLAS